MTTYRQQNVSATLVGERRAIQCAVLDLCNYILFMNERTVIEGDGF